MALGKGQTVKYDGRALIEWALVWLAIWLVLVLLIYGVWRWVR